MRTVCQQNRDFVEREGRSSARGKSRLADSFQYLIARRGIQQNKNFVEFRVGVNSIKSIQQLWLTIY